MLRCSVDFKVRKTEQFEEHVWIHRFSRPRLVRGVEEVSTYVFSKVFAWRIFINVRVSLFAFRRAFFSCFVPRALFSAAAAHFVAQVSVQSKAEDKPKKSTCKRGTPVILQEVVSSLPLGTA